MIEEFSEDAYHRLLQVKYGTEVEELKQEEALVLLLEHRQLPDAALSFTFLPGNVSIDALVVDDGISFQRCGKHKAFERT